ncbi:MAG: hypothetical protein AAF489_03620 [Bacteroidota bacterium]
MSKTTTEPLKTVALYPFTRGLGYAVMTSALDLIEFNLFDLKDYDFEKVKNLVKEIVNTHKPITLILEDTNNRYCRKGRRAKEAIRKIKSWARQNEISIQMYSREQVRAVFDRWHAKNKYEIAEVLKRNLPALKNIVFAKPKYPGREPNYECVFSTISMLITHYFLEE